MQIADFGLPRGEGDKLILRRIATKLGLNYASHLSKRAIQFGSRIVKYGSMDGIDSLAREYNKFMGKTIRDSNGSDVYVPMKSKDQQSC